MSRLKERKGRKFIAIKAELLALDITIKRHRHIIDITIKKFFLKINS